MNPALELVHAASDRPDPYAAAATRAGVAR